MFMKIRISLTGLDLKITNNVQVKVRISLTGLDLKINLNHTDYVYEDSDKFDGIGSKDI